MMTLLQSALTGWTAYIQHGKFPALLLLALIYLGFRIRKTGNTTLYLYGALMTLGCICPVSAVFLMKYQTAFYSYVWIWAAVPQTVLIAWAACDFVCELWKEKGMRSAMLTLLLLGIVFLSGNPVSEWAQAQTAQIQPLTGMYQGAEETPVEVLRILTERNREEKGTQEFALWAPKDVMAAARAYSAEIYPVYGRSIWDASLGSYSYDTYETWQEDLYLWMSHLETTGEAEYMRMDEDTGARKIDFAVCLQRVEEAGTDYILLPGNLSEDTLSELQQTAGRELQPIAGYYLLSAE